jgi:hypothetical protein
LTFEGCLFEVRAEDLRMPKSESKVTKKAGPRVKTPAQLSASLARELNAYAVAATAAGVAVLACATPATASPICKNLSTELFQSSTFPLNPANQNAAPFNIAQTTFSYYLGTTGVSTLLWLNRGFFTPNTAGAKVLLGAKDFPSDMVPGAEIGPGGKFGKGASYGLLFTYGKGNFSGHGGGTLSKHRGNMSLTQKSYVGFQFSQAGKAHYGWARLGVTFHDHRLRTVLRILGYGYESNPDTAIAAGSCDSPEQSSSSTPDAAPQSSHGSSLGMLTLGSAAPAKR